MAATVLPQVSEKVKNIIMGRFPFPSIQNMQDQIIWAMMQSYARGKKFCVLDAGTGIGKSVLGTTAGMIISDDLNVRRQSYCDQHGVSYTPMAPTVITKTRVLQKQYEDSFKGTAMDVAVLWGKTHYSDLTGDTQVGGEEQEIHKCGKSCPGMSYSHDPLSCPYMMAFRDYLNPQNLGVTNNAMYLSAPVFRSGTNVLIVDECHKLPGNLLERSTMELSSDRLLKLMREYNIPDTEYLEACVDYERNVLKEGRIPLKSILAHLQNLVGFALTTIVPHIEQIRESIVDSAPQYTKAVDKLVKKADRALNLVNNLIDKINLILGSSDAAEVTWICWKLEEKGEGDEIPVTTIKVRPLMPLKWTVEELMNKLGFTIFMSATTGDYHTFCHEMHLDPSQGDFISVPTPFPIKNRQVFDLAISGMNYSNRLALLDENGDFTAAILKVANKHQGERGLVHSVSYANAKIIKERLYKTGRQVVIPKSGTVIDREYLSQFASDAILVSPSMAEGVDLKDDLCRWQVILKVPYPSLADLWIRAKLQSDEKWYSDEAVKDILQMSGRGVRHMEDYCTTYVLDSNFRRLTFPEWFTDAVIST